MLEIGLKKEKKYIVTEEITARILKSGELDVLATPALICMLEEAAAELTGEHIEKEQSSVGTSISLSHIAATPVGLEITARVLITKIDGRKIIFEIEAFDEKEKIAEGIHERFIISKEKFMKKAEGKLNG